MFRPFRWPFGAACVFSSLVCTPALAVEPDQQATIPAHWRLVVSPYTLHFRPTDEHKAVWAIGIERQHDDGWLTGAAYFRNSFGQPSGYLYLGERYSGLLDRPPLFFQWSAGLIYGYKDKYEDKLPMNHNGLAPGALVSLGWQFDRRLSAQLNLLGDAGLMLQLSYNWP